MEKDRKRRKIEREKRARDRQKIEGQIRARFLA